MRGRCSGSADASLNRSARQRPALRRRGRKAGKVVQRIAGLVDRQRHHVEQHVGPLMDCMRTADHAAHLPGAHRQRPALAEQPLRSHAGQAQRAAHLVVERQLVLQLDDDPRLVVILQVGADLGRVDDAPSMPSAAQHDRPARCPTTAAIAATAARRRPAAPRHRHARCAVCRSCSHSTPTAREPARSAPE